MWIRQRPEWPNFVVDVSAFSERVETFYRKGERLVGMRSAKRFAKAR